MANARVTNVNLQMRLDGGLVNGKQKYITKSILGVALDASDDGILTVSETLGNLQNKTLVETRKVVVSAISH